MRLFFEVKVNAGLPVELAIKSAKTE